MKCLPNIFKCQFEEYQLITNLWLYNYKGKTGSTDEKKKKNGDYGYRKMHQKDAEDFNLIVWDDTLNPLCSPLQHSFNFHQISKINKCFYSFFDLQKDRIVYK